VPQLVNPLGTEGPARLAVTVSDPGKLVLAGEGVEKVTKSPGRPAP
jgi:hypothetical protein